MTLRALPYGDRAWLIECPADPVAVARWLAGLTWSSRTEVVPGAATCLIRFADTAPSQPEMDALLGRAPKLASVSAVDRGAATIAVRYDGADLRAVADLVGLTPGEVIELHTSGTYQVAFLGFAPGFAYLTGLPEPLCLPRRGVPRVRVPAGSVAIADQYSAVYPRSSPGGWHLLGTTSQWLFDPASRPPSRLLAGMLVRFEAVR